MAAVFEVFGFKYREFIVTQSPMLYLLQSQDLIYRKHAN